jgi:hypothetical protein
VPSWVNAVLWGLLSNGIRLRRAYGATSSMGLMGLMGPVSGVLQVTKCHTIVRPRLPDCRVSPHGSWILDSDSWHLMLAATTRLRYAR